MQLTLSFDEPTPSNSPTLDSRAGSTLLPLAPPPAQALEPRCRNFHLSGPRILAKDPKTRAKDNLAAIRLSKLIEAEAREPTKQDQELLARFTAFGAEDLAKNMFPCGGHAVPQDWQALAQDLENLVTAQELSSLARITQYAHYTPEFLIASIWDALDRLGFRGGRVIEPACGTGLFFALMPQRFASKSSLTGIEIDPVTARIARLLFPGAQILTQDFTKIALPKSYTLAIGNPPFSTRQAAIGQSGLRLSLHDHFIARSLEALEDGGLAAFVTSRWTMDKQDSRARAHIAAMADLIGAIRLPDGAMMERAGTKTGTDLLIFQKRPAGKTARGPAWDTLAQVLPAEGAESPIAINRYFAEHPQMVLGRHARVTSPFGPAYGCIPEPPANLEARIAEAIRFLPEAIHVPSARSVHPAHPLPAIAPATIAEGGTLREGSYLIEDGLLMQILDGTPAPVPIRQGKGTQGIGAKHARIIRALIPIRDAARAVLRAQEQDGRWEPAQMRLRIAYNNFVRAFGPINLTLTTQSTDRETGETRTVQKRPNLSPFFDDPDCWLVSSIEDYCLETGTAKQGPLFTQRVLYPQTEPKIETIDDALAFSLHELGHPNIDHIAALLNRSREDTITLLGDRVFPDPSLSIDRLDHWQTADQYLSGNVRAKLAAARDAAAEDPRFERNVEALRRVQPEDLKPSEISARLGAPWIPAPVIAQFSAEVIGIDTTIRHTQEIASWSVDLAPFAGQAAATSEWGTARRHAGLLLADALNASIPQIYDTVIENGTERRALNAIETEAAKDKLAKIKAAFERWVWTDPERAAKLTRLYNDQFNNIVPRHFDGSHLSLPGTSRLIEFYPHQKRAIWRIMSSGNTYIAHAVGAGKTFTIAASVMEQKRLGLITKALLAVPGHCLAQAAREFLILYPNAGILVADETNFTKDKRLRFLARAATSQWDCIIITHSAFKFIPVSAEFERSLIQSEIEDFAFLLERVDSGDRISRKRIERLKEGLEARLEELKSRKDDLVTIAGLGIDQIIVDEAQEFRKLSFPTNMTNLKGIDPDGSQRAWDLYVKSRYTEKKNPGRGLILSSGTPITNTLGEMYTLQRFLQPEALKERAIHAFDAWASTFGETRTELELQPSGLYKPVTRFSQFVNVPELMAMYRCVADVVLKSDLRRHLKLPAIKGGKREIMTAPPSPAFKAYQKTLGERIRKIEERRGRPQKGDDILLSVITDGRHAAIDLRLVLPGHENEPENKLNAMIDKVHEIWRATANRRYIRPDGIPYALPGSAQMIFSDLGTLSVEEKRGFSAYRWIKTRLVTLGVPAAEIAFMQDYKTSSAKQQLFNAVNAGQIRILIGSSETMGTGVNAQRRLKALHHLDVPWLPSQIEQREGRIERQGNENEEIEIYAWATTGSVDATSWQILERKARFIELAMSGEKAIRRLEDAGSQINQFAMAKAIASGDPRLMQKAGLEAEIAKLERQRDAHLDDQYAVRGTIDSAEKQLGHASRAIERLRKDIAQHVPTKGDTFAMTIEGRLFRERKEAGAAIIKALRKRYFEGKSGSWPIASLGGFEITLAVRLPSLPSLLIERNERQDEIVYEDGIPPLGIIARIEYRLSELSHELAEQEAAAAQAQERLAGYRARLGQPFPYQDELDAKRQELAALDAILASNGQTAAA